MDESTRRFLESVARARCFLRQRGIHPDFDAELATFEAARRDGLVEGRLESLGKASVDFFHAWLTEDGKRRVLQFAQPETARA